MVFETFFYSKTNSSKQDSHSTIPILNKKATGLQKNFYCIENLDISNKLNHYIYLHQLNVLLTLKRLFVLLHQI
jgi:hypothetical protein